MATRFIDEYLKSGEVEDVKIGGTAAEQSALPGDGTKEAKVIQFSPQLSAPPYSEGQVYYNEATGTYDVRGAYSDVTLQMGREMHVEVLNDTAEPILNGKICTQAGVLAGIPLVKLAIADTFDNARIFGIATHDIGVGEKGIVTTFGEVNGLDTIGVTVGVPLFLSAINAGEFVETAPDIVSRVGGVFVADGSNGKLFVYIINNKNLPSVFGGMQGQTVGNETYSLTTVAQDIINYETSENILLELDLLTGIATMPNVGQYRSHFTAAITFASLTSTRSVTVELYNVTTSDIIFSYVKNIPRDATEDSFSFNWPTNQPINSQLKMRIKASVVMDITFTDVSFDIESVNIR